MKKPLAVGDRVAVYSVFGREAGNVEKALDSKGYVRVSTDAGNSLCVHPKQCRRLVPGKPRRRVWLVVPSYGCEWSRAYYDEALARQMPEVLGDSAATIQEFVEVRRKESK